VTTAPRSDVGLGVLLVMGLAVGWSRRRLRVVRP
jgi:MYXO-CTERM domain-containing protein